jgi:hypothetical protein
MTAAFNEFMRQYKMTGSEKADGYSRDAFIGLDEHEKEEVFKLLMQELPFSVEWLFFLDAEKALDVVKEEEEKLRGNAYADVYMLQKELIKYSGDLSYQNHMIEDYPGYEDSLKPRVVESVGNTPTSTAAIDFFRQVILTETNISAVAGAAFALLYALKIPRVTEVEKIKCKQLIDELRNENLQVKLKALNHLARYETSLS